MTPFHTSSSGSSLKCTEIAQSASSKSQSSNLQSKTKHIPSGTKLLEPIPKTVKHSTDIRHNSIIQTNSNEALHSLMSQKADHTSKVSKCSEIQVHGIKPSGLRMPSPSLRFFSETKAPVSSTSSQVNNTQSNLLKSKIPTFKNPKVVDHIHDFKPTQLLHKPPNIHAIEKEVKKVNSSASSNVDPKGCAKEIQVKCNKQSEELQIEPKNDEQCENKVANSLRVEESRTKDIKSNSFQDTRKVDRRILDDSLEFCPEVKLIEGFETNTEAQMQPLESAAFNSFVTNIDVISELQTNSNGHDKKSMLGDDDKVPHESDNGRLSQTCGQRNMEVELDEHDQSTVQECEHDLETVENRDANFSVLVGSKYENLNVKKDVKIFGSKLLTLNQEYDKREEQTQSFRPEIIDDGASNNFATYDQSTENIEQNFREEDKQKVSDNSLLANSHYDIDEGKDKNKDELILEDVFLSANLEDVIKSEEDRSNILPREDETRSFGVNDGLLDVSVENRDDLDDEYRTTNQKSGDQILTKLPSNVVPFSDEWLAAIELAGEEILTMKTGAVKNSPPDKSIPEPSPWSPVKKKSNQVIGPFDCTKYTNL